MPRSQEPSLPNHQNRLPVRTMRKGTRALDELSAARFAADRHRELELEAGRGEDADGACSGGHEASDEGSEVAGERKD